MLCVVIASSCGLIVGVGEGNGVAVAVGSNVAVAVADADGVVAMRVGDTMLGEVTTSAVGVSDGGVELLQAARKIKARHKAKGLGLIIKFSPKVIDDSAC